MATPVRIQRKRTKGYNMQAVSIGVNGLFCVSVTRPSKHGNPYYPGCGIGYGHFDENMRPVHYDVRDRRVQVMWFRQRMTSMRQDEPQRFEALVAEIRGKNVACYCREDELCHGDVWLELAGAQLPSEDR